MNVRCTIYLAIALLWLGQGLRAQQCNNMSLRGNWAFSGMGWAIPFGATEQKADPVTFVGVLTVDFQGRISGPATLIAGFPIPGTPIPAGAVLEMEFVDGTLEVNSDCAGVFKYSVKIKGFPQTIGPYADRVIVLPNNGDMIGLAVKSPISYPIWRWTARRMSYQPSPVAWPDVQ